MISPIYKVIALVMIIQFTSVKSQLITYDPTTGGGSGTILHRDPDSFSWLIKRTLTGGSYSIDSFRYDPTATGFNKKSEFGIGILPAVKAVSKRATCAVLIN